MKPVHVLERVPQTGGRSGALDAQDCDWSRRADAELAEGDSHGFEIKRDFAQGWAGAVSLSMMWRNAGEVSLISEAFKPHETTK